MLRLLREFPARARAPPDFRIYMRALRVLGEGELSCSLFFFFFLVALREWVAVGFLGFTVEAGFLG